MKLKRAGITRLLICMLTGLALAQEFRGRVQGVVSDPSGAVIPGATTVLKNDATGVDITRVTNSEGRYFFDYVDPGTYTLTVELTGFKTAVQKNIVVAQRGDVTVDMKLEVGNLSETVTVTEIAGGRPVQHGFARSYPGQADGGGFAFGHAQSLAAGASRPDRGQSREPGRDPAVP